MVDNAYFRAPLSGWMETKPMARASPPTSGRGATTYVSTKGLCVTGRGNPPSLHHASVMMQMVLHRGRDGRVGENRRVEPGGKGCAIIRSLRGGMRSVVETLSLRIQAEPPEGGQTPNICATRTHR